MGRKSRGDVSARHNVPRPGIMPPPTHLLTEGLDGLRERRLHHPEKLWGDPVPPADGPPVFNCLSGSTPTTTWLHDLAS